MAFGINDELNCVVKNDKFKCRGVFISSGIINTKEKAVREALINNGFDIVSTDYMGEWVSFVAR